MKNLLKHFLIDKEQYYHQRIDRVLTMLEQTYSRHQIQKLIKNNQITVNQKHVKANYLIKKNDQITIIINKTSTKLKAEKKPLKIIYEDKYLLIIDKPRGLVVHPGNGNHQHTLVNILLSYTKHLSNIDQNRPGIVHRLDKNTSGLLLIAKNNFIHRYLTLQLAKHLIQRQYKALVSGIITEDKGRIIAPIAHSQINHLKMTVDIQHGKEAETIFRVIKRYPKATLVQIKLKQGRTHQIRVHFTYIKHPIIGDNIYGTNNKQLINNGQILHAYKIGFIHPITKKKMTFTSPLPTYFKDAIKLYCH